jgi:hypothetical protein
MVAGFGLAVLARLVQLVLGFYGFWLVWRVLLPVLPSARNPDQDISPFAVPLTDPLVAPLVRLLRLPPWPAVLLLLVADAAALAGLGRVS